MKGKKTIDCMVGFHGECGSVYEEERSTCACKCHSKSKKKKVQAAQ